MTAENAPEAGERAGSKPEARAAEAPKLTTKMIAADVLERVLVLGLFVNFVGQMLGNSAFEINIVLVLIVISETLPVALMSMRGPSPTMSTRVDDWLVGFAGSAAPLLAVAPGNETAVPIAVAASVMLCGMAFQIYGKLSLGTSFGVVAANRGVKVKGAYRFVRHPIYAGYTVTHIGFLMAYPCLQNFLVYGIGLAFQIMRMDREERILLQDDAYRVFAQTTRYRLLPGFY